jgi:hypothetical protein
VYVSEGAAAEHLPPKQSGASWWPPAWHVGEQVLFAALRLFV